MMARGFKSVGWAAAVAGTALGCYMVSLKVASERAALEDVENRIVLAQRDIRILQTEIGTRGRLEQLEKWNVKVLALSAPSHNQFLEGSFQLATLTAPKKTVDPAAPVVLASAPAPEPKQALADDARAEPAAGPSPGDLMHVASLKREEPVAAAPAPQPKPKAVPQKTVDKQPEAKSTKAAIETKAAKPKPESPAKPVKSAAAEPKPTTTTKTKDTKSRQ